MAGLKEFKEKLESDHSFSAKFAEVKSENEFIKRARAEGYYLEQLSDDELDNVAGGNGEGIIAEILRRFSFDSGKFSGKMVAR